MVNNCGLNCVCCVCVCKYFFFVPMSTKTNKRLTSCSGCPKATSSAWSNICCFPPLSPKCYILYKAPLKMWVKLKTKKTAMCIMCTFKSTSSWTNVFSQLLCVTVAPHRSNCPPIVDVSLNSNATNRFVSSVTSHWVNRVEQVSLKWS